MAATPNDDELRKLLERDPLDEVEKGLHVEPELPAQEGILGDNDKFENGNEALAHALKVNALKKGALLSTGDSVYGDNLSRYLRLVDVVGFKVVLVVPFTAKSPWDEKSRDEKLFFLWRDDGILLVFDTYGGDTVNSGHFYYNWVPNEGANWRVTSSGGYSSKGPQWPSPGSIWAGHHDCREGLRFHIRQLEKNGRFLAKWFERPFLWLLHYGDTQDKQWPDLKSEEINAERIKMLPAKVQEAITPANL